jgi:beta-glucuronidase
MGRGAGLQDHLLRQAETFANAQAQLTDLFVRDKNRASVVVWSIGNETRSPRRETPSGGELVRTVRSLDGTRVVSAALDIHQKGRSITIEDPLADMLDQPPPTNTPASTEPVMLRCWNFRSDIRPNRSVVITEFGTDAFGSYHAGADTRWSEDFPNALHVNQLRMLDGIPLPRMMTPLCTGGFRSARCTHLYF